jgi:hypothetical protein
MSGRLGSRTVGFKTVTRQMAQPTFRHVTPARVARPEKENRHFAHIGENIFAYANMSRPHASPDISMEDAPSVSY